NPLSNIHTPFLPLSLPTNGNDWASIPRQKYPPPAKCIFDTIAKNAGSPVPLETGCLYHWPGYKYNNNSLLLMMDKFHSWVIMILIGIRIQSYIYVYKR